MGGISQVKAALSAIGRYRGVSQLYCRKSRFKGPLSRGVSHFYREGPDYVADPFKLFIVGAFHRRERGKGQIGKILEKNRANPREKWGRPRSLATKDKSGQTNPNRDRRAQIGKSPRLKPGGRKWQNAGHKATNLINLFFGH